jgi:hypothetical protein
MRINGKVTFNRKAAQIAVIALVALLVGVACTAAVFAYIPDYGSPPAVYDDFNYSTTGSGFWHVNADGGDSAIKQSILNVFGASIELDRRIQTDPKETVISVRMRALRFGKFGFGIGVYHAGTVGMEFDGDGIKCGRGTDFGYQVDWVKRWKTPPVGKWFLLRVAVHNPYPDPKVLDKLGNIDSSKLKKVKLVCSAWDDQGHLIGEATPKEPPPNAHYPGFDEIFMRTWDSGNNYQVDWFYAGPPSGDPLRWIVHART